MIADDVGFAKALNRVLFGNINGVGIADVVEIVHEWLPLYMLTCAHIEQRLMPNPQRFEGLEEDITWYSNRGVPLQAGVFGLEEDRLHGTQPPGKGGRTYVSGWKEVKLQGAQLPLRDESSQSSFESGSNYRVLKLDVRCAGLANWFEGNRITEFSNACYTLLHGVLRVWKKINYKDLKLTSVFAPEQLWFGKR